MKRPKRERGFHVLLNERELARWQATADRYGTSIAEMVRDSVNVMADELGVPPHHKQERNRRETANA